MPGRLGAWAPSGAWELSAPPPAAVLGAAPCTLPLPGRSSCASPAIPPLHAALPHAFCWHSRPAPVPASCQTRLHSFVPTTVPTCLHSSMAWHGMAHSRPLRPPLPSPPAPKSALPAPQPPAPAPLQRQVRTSRVFLRDVSVTSPMASLLFGGALRVAHEGGYVAVDDWIRIRWVGPLPPSLSPVPTCPCFTGCSAGLLRGSPAGVGMGRRASFPEVAQPCVQGAPGAA